MARPRLLSLLFILALLAAACGSGSEAVVVAGPSLQPSAGAPSLGDSGVTGEATVEDATAVGDEDGNEDGFKLDISGLGEDSEDATADGGDDGNGNGAAGGVAFLRSAATETTAVDSYRFDVRFEMYIAEGATVLDIAPDEPLSVGAVSGDRTWLFSDVGPIFDAIFAAAGNGSAQDLLGGDLSMEAITEGPTLYLRAPLFASLAQLGALPGADDLVALGDGWGSVDLLATGLTPEQLAGLTGAQTGASAEDLLELLGGVAGQVTEQGPSEVRGVPTTRYRAEIQLDEVLAAQGMSMNDVAGLAGARVGNVRIPFDIDVDADGRVRRMAVVIDTSFIAELVGEPVPAGVEARISSIVELYDFGADIEIVDPSTLGATDVTAAFMALANS